METLELTRKLIDIRSTTGEESAIMVFLAEYLENIGFQVSKQKVEKDRFNILAKVGEPRAVLSTHTDTVPPYFPLSEDEEYIYGRGACDTKGIIAAQIKAAELLLKQDIRNFGLLFMVGEEEKSDGAAAANTIPNTCRWLVNGEPTANKMAVGTKGALNVKLTVKGKACHSAYPEQGESAIDKMLDILTDINQIQWPVHERLGATTCNIGVISGGIQPNVLAPHAEAQLMFRVVTSTNDIKEQLREVVSVRGELDFYFACEPIITHVLDGFPTMIAAYRTDIPFLTNWGTPLLLGPGNILDAHSPGEKIAKAQILEAVDHYADIIRRLLHEEGV
ncbi:MAG: M20/M25/M40 family metallo-hydrolase [Candidatus Aminicenantes bacterium]|jgi:acetylornithine deacetylase